MACFRSISKTLQLLHSVLKGNVTTLTTVYSNLRTNVLKDTLVSNKEEKHATLLFSLAHSCKCKLWLLICKMYSFVYDTKKLL